MGIKKHNVVSLPIHKIEFIDVDLKDNDFQHFEKLKNTIKKRGQLRNVVVCELENEKYLCIEGSKIVKALKELNDNEVSCINLGILSQDEIEHVRIEISRDYFPTNYVAIGISLKNIVKSKKIEEICTTIPYTIRQCENMMSMSTFDWESLNNSKKIEGQVSLFDFTDDILVEEEDIPEIDFTKKESVSEHQIIDQPSMFDESEIIESQPEKPIENEQQEQKSLFDSEPVQETIEIQPQTVIEDDKKEESLIASSIPYSDDESEQESNLQTVQTIETEVPCEIPIEESNVEDLQETSTTEPEVVEEVIEVDTSKHKYLMQQDYLVIQDETLIEEIHNHVKQLSEKFIIDKYPNVKIKESIVCIRMGNNKEIIQVSIMGEYGMNYRVKPFQIIEQLELLISKI